MLTILQIAFRQTARYWKMTLFIFIINLVFALIIAQPFYSTLSQQASNSMEMDKLVADFDYTVFSDFMRISGIKLAFLLPIILVLGIIYFLLNIFFGGGIIDKYVNTNESFSVGRFMSASKSYFLRFIGIFLLQILLLIPVLLICGILFYISGTIAEGGSERTYFYAFLFPFLLFVGLISIVWLIGDYAKVMIFKENCSVWKAFMAATSYVFKNFKTVGLYWILLGIFLILSLIYLFIDTAIGMKSAFTIGLMFILQQAFVFIRVFMRNWQIGTASEFYSLRPLPNLRLRQAEIPQAQWTETLDNEEVESREDSSDIQ